MKWVEYLEKIDQNLLLILNGNNEPFIDQMTKLKPNMKNMSLVCVDFQTLQNLKKTNKMKKL